MSVLNDVFTILKFGWPFLILIGIVFAKIKMKPWVIDVVILEKRGDNIIKTNDRAARYTDKFTQLTGYKLQKAKDTIPVIEYNWILHNVPKHTNLLERFVHLLRPTLGTLFLFKYGSKQYKPIPIDMNQSAEKKLVLVKDNDGNNIYVERFQQFDPRGTLNAVRMEIFDWDNMNFAFQEMRSSFERRQKEGQWMKTILMPMALVAGAIIVSIIMIKTSADFTPPSVPTQGTPTLANQPAATPNIPLIGDAFVPK